MARVCEHDRARMPAGAEVGGGWIKLRDSSVLLLHRGRDVVTDSVYDRELAGDLPRVLNKPGPCHMALPVIFERRLRRAGESAQQKTGVAEPCRKSIQSNRGIEGL